MEHVYLVQSPSGRYLTINDGWTKKLDPELILEFMFKEDAKDTAQWLERTSKRKGYKAVTAEVVLRVVQ